ncbi:hypothetical protein [Burkholderia plantarii]|uniref:hypothetical protein n=1 Tax=Burkholderia plantarii TaxID=41899 RepID=UPI0018DD1CF8|nr:hypothetical protein [Burkholderia plantarii]MBI0329494.1 hypothetical protein [Burkholderia plantarii]
MKTTKSGSRVMAAVLAAAALGMLAHGAAHAEQYQSGATRWDIKGGKLMMVAGVLDDNSRLHYLNYAFYVQAGDNALYLAPIVDDPKKLNDYRLNFSTFNGGGEILTDAVVAVKGASTYLVTAHKDAVHGYNRPAAVTTRTYRLVEGDEAQWRWYFAPVAQGAYSEQQNYTVERALAETAKALH